MKLTEKWTTKGVVKAILLMMLIISIIAIYLSTLSWGEWFHLFDVYETYEAGINQLSLSLVLVLSILIIFSWFYTKTQNRLEDFEATRLIKLICIWLGFAYLMAIAAGLGFLKIDVFGMAVNRVSMTVSILISVIGLIAIWGLWKLEYWAWLTMMVLQAFSAIITMLNYKASSLQVIISYTIIPLAVIVILFEERDIFQSGGT